MYVFKLRDRKEILCTNLESLDWGGGGGGGSLGLMGALTAVVALIFSLKDCEIPRRPNRVEVEEPELLKASLKFM